jgi:ABC-type uncharacterized transport system substrate-binding protein
LRILLPLICMILINGCATVDKSDVIATPKPQVVVSPPVTSKAQSVSPKKQAPARVIPRPQAEILLSGDAHAYRDIAEQLNLLLAKPLKIFTLTGDSVKDVAIIDQIGDSSQAQIVAVGLRAALAVRDLRGKQIVFCQVFNYHDHDLISANMKGVGALPSPRKLFTEWKQLSPQLDQVLVITGSGFDDYIAMAQVAASQSDIELVHQVVATDREFLYQVKHNMEPTDGHWLLADNRILSVKILKEVMAFNSKKAIQTVVFQPDLLAFGGLFYVSPSTQEISGKVKLRLEELTPGWTIESDDMVMLDDHVMGINAQVARQLGLAIPDEFQPRTHGQ